MAAEDERAAVGFSTTLSGQLIAGATATLAIECAFVSYVVGSRAFRSGFIICAALAAFLIICSIFKGGKGIVEARNSGFQGKWNLDKGKREFNWQAIFLVGALIMLGTAAVLSGSPKESKLEQKLEYLCQQVGGLRNELELHRDLDLAAKGIEERLRDMTVELQKFRPSPTPQPIKTPRHR